jgi:thiamine kinase-like enzyme
MEYVPEIFENISSLLFGKEDSENMAEVEVRCERMNGLSNAIYKVEVIDKSSNILISEFIYRIFGEIGGLVDRNLENYIINSLSGPGFSAKILETDNKTYRMEEYIKNSSELCRTEIMDPMIIDKVIDILISYTLISNIYSYYISSSSLEEDIKIQIDSDLILNKNLKEERITQNIFDMCTKNMYIKARESFHRFTTKFHKRMEKLKTKYSAEKLYNLESYLVIKNFIDNYQELFLSLFPKKLLFVLNHNDVHRLNIMKGIDNGDLKILDHEYAALNLIGIDIVNYMIESTFDYTSKEYPYFTFNQNGIDFQQFYLIFTQFIEKFESSHMKNIELPNEVFEYKMRKVKSYKYFLKLFCIISLFWLLYSIIYMDIDKIVKKDSFDSFKHALDRITIFQMAYKELCSFKNSKDL